MAARGQARLPVSGCQISRAEIRHLVDRLRKMSLKQRREVAGVHADRADIIVPGLATIDRIMRRFKVNLLQVHTFGVRDGLLLCMTESLQGTRQTQPEDDTARIERFAVACGVELAHARQSAKLATDIYDGLSKLYDLDLEDIRLLDAAARMQDVGYLINYEGHHKHSYHLILHSSIESFRPKELEIIANIARYHRGAEPMNKHKNFRVLSKGDQQRVAQMASILRLAGGLDRSYNQSIESVKVRGTKKQTELLVSADEYPEVDLWATRRTARLFEKVFHTEATIQWDAPTSAATK